MKIYFAGSIRGGRDYARTYYELIRHIGTLDEAKAAINAFLTTLHE
jgi:hypothetical protein